MHLAVYFAPHRRPSDIFLFEVIGNFGQGMIDDRQKIFEVGFGGSDDLPLGPGQSLRLLLTSPEEFERTVKEDWRAIKELREERAQRRFQVLRQDKEGKRLLGLF